MILPVIISQAQARDNGKPLNIGWLKKHIFKTMCAVKSHFVARYKTNLQKRAVFILPYLFKCPIFL